LLQDEKGKRAEKIDFGEKSAFGWRKARASLVESPLAVNAGQCARLAGRKARASLVESPRNFYGSSNP
jgi:hypothetical protein